MKRKNIALIGFMGTGKTTVGKLLSKKLNMKFVESDNIIVEQANKSINEIFEKFGEEKFREIEKNIIKKLSKEKNTIISCGGGVVIKKENISNLQKSSIIILLNSEIKEIIKRLETDKSRPLLKSENKLEKKKRITLLLDKRKDLYLDSADIIIDTTGKKPEQITEEIISVMKVLK